MLSEKDLMSLKEEIDQAKTDLSEYQGQRKQMLQELKANWNCITVEEAEVLIKEQKKQIKELEDDITQGLKQLEKDYNAFR